MDGAWVGIGRRRRHGIPAMFVLFVLLLIISGATRAAADDPTPDASPSPDDTSASPSSSPSSGTSAVPQPTEPVPSTESPTAAAGEPVSETPTAAAAEPAITPAGTAAGTPALTPAGTADRAIDPSSAVAELDATTPVHSENAAVTGTATSPATSDTARSGAVEELISSYVESVVRAAVVDANGLASPCICALAISVSLDGPTNAVAALGRLSEPASDVGAGAGGRSGRSGDATAVSITGGGSATSSATSGSTGAVSTLSTMSTPLRSAGARSRSTVIDVGAITSSLRQLVTGLGAEMATAADADTSAHVADLLAGLGTTRAEARGTLTVDVASWDREAGSSSSGADLLRCTVDDGHATVPSCGLAVALSAGDGAQATVLPPVLSRVAMPTGSSVGTPGMATAVSVAVSGSAVSAARSGDAGARVPHAAVVDPGRNDTTGDSVASTASSGSSGNSVAVAVTVRGASATTARSGDTGSALRLVSPGSGSEPGTSVVGATPGAGGAASASASSGDSGGTWSLSSGGSGALGESRSGDTGDAIASAVNGFAGRDWSVLAAPANGVAGGAGGAADATASSGRTGSSMSVVISGGSAAASATSGPTGDSTAAAVGGRGGDTHQAAGGTDRTQAGDGGSASTAGASGDTGSAVAVLVTPYDGSASGRSGRSGQVRSFARGGDAGCTSIGVAPEKACRAEVLENAQQPQNTDGSAPSAVGSLATDAAAPRQGTTRAAPKPAAARDPGATAPPAGEPARGVRVEARSRGSADVACVVRRERGVCRSGDTAPVTVTSGAGTEARQPSPVTVLSVVGAAASSTAGDQMQPVGSSGGSARQRESEAGVSLVVLLVNASVPLLALLSLLAMFMTSRRKRAAHAPVHIPKHRRKQPLPAASVPARHR